MKTTMAQQRRQEVQEHLDELTTLSELPFSDIVEDAAWKIVGRLANRAALKVLAKEAEQYPESILKSIRAVDRKFRDESFKTIGSKVSLYDGYWEPEELKLLKPETVQAYRAVLCDIIVAGFDDIIDGRLEMLMLKLKLIVADLDEQEDEIRTARRAAEDAAEAAGGPAEPLTAEQQESQKV